MRQPDTLLGACAAVCCVQEQERLQQEAAAAAAAMAPPQPEAPPMSRLARKFRQQFRQKRVVPEVED